MKIHEAHLLRTVKTPDGIGRIVNLTILHDATSVGGLQDAYAVVWYGIDKASECNGWISKEYLVGKLSVIDEEAPGKVVEEIEDKDV